MNRTRTASTVAGLAAALLLAGCPKDTEAPLPPNVDDPAALTNQSPITVTGTTEPGAAVEISGGAQAALGIAGADGSFSIDVMLMADADNTLAVTATDEAGNASAATTVSVTHDGTAPGAPALDPVASPTPFLTVTVSGTTEAAATVAITGAATDMTVTADATGAFSADIDLVTTPEPAANMLSVVATDAAGNASAATTLTVTFDSSVLAPPVLDALPAFTSAPTLTLTGTAFIGASVSITGGLGSATGLALDGTFSIDVDLVPNDVNTLTVTAFTGTQVSAPVFVVVTHDDIAPAAVSLNPVTSPTGAPTQDVSGLAEPLAAVDITGGASAAATVADAAGNFLASVMLDASCDPCDTTLTITQTDQAGNVGAAIMAVIHYDSSLPVPVDVDQPASPTNMNPIILTGAAASLGDMIQVDGSADALPPATTAGAGGSFMVSVTLFANSTTVLGVHEIGSSVVTFVTVIHDDVAPVAPSVNPVGSPTNMAFVNVSGTTDPGASVNITRNPAGFSDTVIADASGDWTDIIALDTSAAMTSNGFTFVATDAAGNASGSTMLSIDYDSTLSLSAPVVDPQPSFTQTADVMITGTVSSSNLATTTLDITGAASDYLALAIDPITGDFAQLVTLSANAANDLSFVAHLGSMVSPATIVTITHDDMAPAAPAMSLISVSDEAAAPPSGLCVRSTNSASVTGTIDGMTMAGSVEPNALVSVDNTADGAGAILTTADGMGAWTLTINACQGDALTVIQTDQAGNVSSSATVPVP